MRIRDPGWRQFGSGIRDPGWKKVGSGSATLEERERFRKGWNTHEKKDQ